LPDGRLASGSKSWIWLWDVTSGETAWLKGHTSDVNALCALPDGRLASGSDDKTIRLWDLVGRQEITRLEVDAPIFSLVALSDARLVAGDQRGLLHWLEIVN